MTAARRLLRAFSLRQNLTALFVPPGEHLRALDGIRALSILWVVVFHAGWYIGLHIAVPEYARLVFSPWMLPVWRGDFGVDIFFVLSGFLIAGMLLSEWGRTGRLRLGLFYVRRLMRLWPALCVAAAASAFLLGDHPERIWASLLYVSNLVPVREGTMGWTWSLATEEQFYLVCPWLVRALAPVRPRPRFATIAIIAATLSGLAAWVVVSGRFSVLDSEIVVDRPFEIWAVGYDHLYSKPWMRAGALLMGVAAAFVFRNRAAMAALAKNGRAAAAGLAVAAVVAALCMHWPLVAGAPRGAEVAFLATYRTVFGACVAYGILLSVSDNAVGRVLGRILGSRLLYPFGQLAYSAYLLNPIMTTLVDDRLAPQVWDRGWVAFAFFLPADALATFLAAAVVYVFVERPFMALRPR